MITITNNYVQDWAAAREAGIVQGRRPSKEVLYAAIESYNQQQDELALAGAYGLAAMYATQERHGITPADRLPAEEAELAEEVAAEITPAELPAKRYEWVEVEVDRFDLPEGVNRCDFVPGFNEWFSACGQYSRVEGSIHEGYVAYNNQRVEVEPEAELAEPVAEVEEGVNTLEPVNTQEAALSDDEEAALQAELLALDAAEDEAKAEAAAQAKAAKQSRKKSASEQAAINAADLAKYQRIVNLKGQLGAKKAAEQLTAEGTKMGGTTVCQICTTYYSVLMASDLLQQWFNEGLITWGQLYSRSRKINIPAIEAELGGKLAS